MSIWEILGIEPTKDKDEITKAYREKLAVTNPEDKPEEFMQLRQAYEEALTQTKEKEDTPISRWSLRLKQLYDDMEKRVQFSCWKELFVDPLCTSFDTKNAIEEAVLLFLNDSSTLDQEIWRFFDEFFDFTNRRDELKEKYPPQFIDYFLIREIHKEESFPLTLFSPCKDAQACDRYVACYYALLKGNDNIENPKEYMLQSVEQHPYGKALLILEEEAPKTEKIEKLKELVEQYPNEAQLLVWLGELMQDEEQYEQCNQYCQKYLENHPDKFSIQKISFTCRIKMNDYTVAEDIHYCYGNDNISVTAEEELNTLCDMASEVRVKYYEGEQEKRELTKDELFKLAESYCDLQQNDKVETVMNQLSSEDNPCNYYRMQYVILSAKEKNEEAIEAIDLYEVNTRNADLSVVKNQRRLKSLGNILVCKVTLLRELNRIDEAKQLLRNVFDEFKSNVRTLHYIFQGGLILNDVELAEMCGDELIRLRPQWYEGYFIRAHVRYIGSRQGLGEALYWINYSTYLFSGDLQAFLLKTRILIASESLDEAQQYIDLFEQTPVKDYPMVLYCKARLLDAKEQEDEAYKMYQSLYDKREQLGSLFNMEQEFLYRYLVLKERHTDYKKKNQIEDLLKLADEGLKLRPDHYGTRDYHAFILLRLDRTDEALKEYLSLSELPYHSPEIDERIGNIYFDRMETKADKAVEYYRKALDNDGDDFDRYYIGVSLYHMQRFEESKAELTALNETQKDDVDVLRWKTYSEAALDQLEEALEDSYQIAELVKDSEKDQSTRYAIVLKMLRRLGRFDDALKMAEKFRKNGNYKKYYYHCGEILLQCGRTKEARKMAAKLMKSKDANDKANAAYQIIASHILDENNAMINLSYHNYRGVLAKRRPEMLAILMEYFYNNRSRINTAKKRLRTAKEENDSYSFSIHYHNLCECYFHSGNLEESKKYAQKTLEETDRMLAKNIDCCSLYHSKRIMPLAVLGRYDEAKAEIDYCNSKAKCLMCDETGCKDALIFEAYYEETRGNLERALEICQQGRKLYPGETDFVCYSRYYKRKISYLKKVNKKK